MRKYFLQILIGLITFFSLTITVKRTSAQATNVKISYYVKQNATGTNNGLSWNNAYTNIYSAFAAARAGDTIRVAKGVYKPGNTASVVLTLRDSLIILGGYSDSGNPSDELRDFSENQTIISGEIGGPGLQDNIEGLFNALNLKVVLIDGFIIENFYAGYTAVNSWGPITIKNSTIKFRNTVIRNNYNGNETCGLNILQGSIVTLENCFIEKNESYSVYGGVLKVNKSKLNIVNSIIAKNKAPRIIVSNEADISLKNSNVFKNYGFSEIKDTSTLAVTNSIFYENYDDYAVDISEFSKDSYSSIQMDNTITQFYNVGNAGFMGGNPMFIDSANIAGIDGKYFNSDDGLHLLNPCSKAINTGNNNYVSAIANDITGAPRIENGIVDLGAYEVQEVITSATAVIYVNVNAYGTNNGSSWNNAFRSLQQALNTCADTIKIATGIYKVSETDAFASFELQNNVVIIGGYSGTGNNDIPNPVTYPTILDGTMANGEKVHTVVKSIDNNSNTKLINVEIKNTTIHYYGNQGYRENGALEVSNHSEAVFENVTISDYYNDASNLVLVHSYSKPVFRNCNFYNGDGNSNLGDITTGSYPKFLNCYFGKDTTATYPVALTGATMSISNAKAKIDSCIFYKVNMDAFNIRAGADVEIVSTQFIKTNGRSINMNGGNASFSKSVFKDTLIMRSFSEIDRGTSIHSSLATAQYTDCKFYDAYAEGYAPFSQITGGSNVTYKRCFFINGKTGMDGTPSGFYVSGSTLNLINSVISNPLQSRYLFECENGSELNIIGSTIIQQSSQEEAPRASSNGVVWCRDNSKLKLYNSVFWRYGNSNLILSQENDVISSNLNDPLLCDIRNSYLFKQANTLTQNSHIGIDPKFSDLSNPYGPDNILGTEDDGYMLCNCSPLVNAGNNSLNTEIVDIKNQTRIFGSAVDIGAYEIHENTDNTKTFYVKENAPANGNGKTWATAYNSLQKAVLNNCAEIIKVSQGTYKPSVYSRDSSFNIYRGVNILGGYPNVGNPTDAQRDPLLYPTILSGEIGIENDSSDNILNIVTAHCPDSVITLEGLIIEKGNGGISANGCYKLNINNCIIRNNHTLRGGGGLNSFGSFLEINKTIFTNNTSGGAGGGAIYVRESNYYEGFPSQPGITKGLIKNSVFENNRSERYGGAIANFGSGTVIENSIFYKNEAFRGAGISSTNSSLVITNCNFIKNNITELGYGIGVNIESTQSIPFSPYCYNSVFAGNTVFGTAPDSYSSEFSWNNGQIGSFETPFTVQYNVFSNNYRALGFNIRYYYGSMFVDENNPKGADGLWFTADDGLKPSPCSLLQDAGANDKVENIIPVDILGNIRILNNTVDIGAYEGPGKMKTKIVSSDTTLCAAVPITFRASTNSYNITNNVYQWYLNGATVGTNRDTFLLSVPSNNDKVWVTVINATCGTPSAVSSDTIELNIGTSAPIQLSITASGNNICAGTNVTFSSSFIGDIIDSTYQWKVNGNNVGTNSASFSSSSLAQGDIVSLIISGQSLCSGTLTSNSNNITMNVSQNQTPDVQLSSTATSICQNQSLTFTATPANEGTQPNYEWFINGTSVSVTNQNTYTASSLTENTEVKVVLASSLTCTTSTTDTSNIVTITVNPIVTPSVSITTPSTTICAGSSITFTAVPINGGNTPIYTWRVNNAITGTNSPTFTSSSLADNDEVRVSMTSNQLCITDPTVVSNPTIISVSGSVVPSVSLQTSETTVCANTPVTFEAINETNMGNATYKWFVNGNEINGANSSVFTYSNFMVGIQTISLVTNSSLSCASPSSVTVTVTIAVDATVNSTISIPPTAEVEMGGSVNINATVQNAGTSPIYQWQDSTAQHSWQNIPASNQQQLIYTPNSNGDKIRVQLSSNAQCASPNTVLSNALVFTVIDTTQIGGRIYLYPNPASTLVTVAGMQLTDNWKTLDLIDMNGRRVISKMNIENQTSVQLSVGQYSSGIYIVLLRKENGETKYLKLARQ